MPPEVQRKLTTILAADAEGYSRVMETDEVGGLAALRAARQVFSKFIERHHGRIANTAGDGLIAEFPSVVEAVQCAIEVQQELGARPGDPARALNFRIGVHLGDVMVDGNDLLGEGVNLAARLQTMAAPGEVLISQQVFDQVHEKLSVGFDYLGERHPKNYSKEVPVYRVASGKGAPRSARPGYRVSYPPPEPEVADRGVARARVLRHARMLGVAWAALLVIDLTTGSPFWAYWPGLAIAVVLGLEAAPVYAPDWLPPRLARSLVLVAGLLTVNLVTWSGYPWALWPAGALIALQLLRRTDRARR